MKAIDFYDMVSLPNKLYIFVVNGDIHSNAFGVFVQLYATRIEIDAAKITNGSRQNITEFNIEIDNLYKELTEMDHEDLRNLIDSKMKLKKFNL